MSRILFHFQRLCCALALWFPRVGVNLITTWGLYVLLFNLAFNFYEGFWRWVYVITGLWTYTMTTIAYYRTVSRGAGSPLDLPGFRADYSDLEAGSVAPPPAVFNNITAKDNGEMRFCNKCNCWKPDRTHHCRTCNKCMLRMDHHCPWFSACIGYNNHKFFIQFLCYVAVFCEICFAAAITALVRFFKDGSYLRHYPTLSWVALSVAGGVMGFAVVCFSGYSLYLVFRNKTTLEMLETVRYKSSIPSQEYRFREAPSSQSVGNVFDLGWKRNWCSVMGDKWVEWVLPIVPANQTNGTSFPINQDMWIEVETYANSEMTAMEQQRQYVYQQRELQRQHIQRQRELQRQHIDQELQEEARNNYPLEEEYSREAESIPLTQRY